MQRDDSLLLDMLQAPRQILEYTNGLQEPDFLSSRRGPGCRAASVYSTW